MIHSYHPCTRGGKEDNVRRITICVASALLALVLLAAGAAALTTGNLPGGTSISVGITAPADGLLIAYPPGTFPLNGTASIGEGQAVPNTLIVYVLDVSYSAIMDPGAGCGGDANNDGMSDTVLDCEIAAARALNQLAIGAGTVGQVGVAVYGGVEVSDPLDQSGRAADVGPGSGSQLLTGPATGLGTPGGPDVEEVLASAFVDPGQRSGGVHKFTDTNVGSNGTNFGKGLEAAVTIVNASTMPNKVIIFMSDGQATTGPGIGSVSVPSNVLIKAFAIGKGSTCAGSSTYGTLTGVAAKGAPGSDCTEVDEVSDLPDVIPGVIGSQLTKLELSINGGPAENITSFASRSLPVPGPASVTYDRGSLTKLPLIYELCVTAIGSDVGGAGSVEECVEVTVANIQLAPKTAVNAVGTSHTVVATVAAGKDGGVGSVEVRFKVISGPNEGMTGSATTDSSGQASFTYLDDGGLGTDQIEACFTDDLKVTVCDEAEKTWIDIELTPKTAINAVGASHTVTATISGVNGGMSGVPVSFEVVSGPNAGTNSSAITKSSGQASFTYAGNGGPGIDHIEACFTYDLGVTVCDDAEKTWLGLEVTPKTATNELGTDDKTHTINATVSAGPGIGVPGVSVTFEVISGPNAGISFSAVTDSAGQASFTYTGKQGLAGMGTDVIRICFSDPQGFKLCKTAEKHWVDTTPPAGACAEGTNPHGKTKPGAKNEDGFYELLAEDAVYPDPEIYVIDSGSGTVWGPFSSGTQIKYTEAPGAPPSQKKIGSDQGQAGAVAWHITGNADACIYAVDAAGNRSECNCCLLVPPPPK